MKKAIEAYKEMIIGGVSSTVASQVVQATFGLSNEELEIVADSGRRDAALEQCNMRELCYE